MNRQQGKRHANVLQQKLSVGAALSDREFREQDLADPFRGRGQASSKPKTLAEKCAKAQNGQKFKTQLPLPQVPTGSTAYQYTDLDIRLAAPSLAMPQTPAIYSPAHKKLESAYSSPSSSSSSLSNNKNQAKARWVTTLFTSENSVPKAITTYGQQDTIRSTSAVPTLVDIQQNQNKIWISQPTLQQTPMSVAHQIRSMQNLYSSNPINAIQVGSRSWSLNAS